MLYETNTYLFPCPPDEWHIVSYGLFNWRRRLARKPEIVGYFWGEPEQAVKPLSWFDVRVKGIAYERTRANQSKR